MLVKLRHRQTWIEDVGDQDRAVQPLHHPADYRANVYSLDLDPALGLQEWASSTADQNGDGAVNYLDIIANLKGLTRHELIHILGAVSGIDPANPSASQPNRHDTFLFDSAGRPLLNPDGTVSTTASLHDPNA